MVNRSQPGRENLVKGEGDRRPGEETDESAEAPGGRGRNQPGEERRGDRGKPDRSREDPRRRLATQEARSPAGHGVVERRPGAEGPLEPSFGIEAQDSRRMSGGIDNALGVVEVVERPDLRSTAGEGRWVIGDPSEKADKENETKTRR